MRLRFSKVLCAALLSGVAVPSFACTVPPLVAIPAKDQIADKATQIGAEVSAYFEAMKTYAACIQQELTAVGDAQPAIKALLVQRNNVAVAEAQAVQKVYNEHMAAAAPAPAAPAEGGGRRRNR
ncbi:MAG TPA: hypothetical protein VFX89_19250 [Gammaproteobacteria bacterium]|nr:hypothetical protein [Gammaproteobacteria bacterium]